MSAQLDLSKLSVGQFAERFRSEMIPISNTFSYFCASVPLTDEDVKEYLQEPIAALPPAVASRLPKISIILVPYLERANGKQKPSGRNSEFISIQKPPESRLSWNSQLRVGDQEVLVFALKDQEVAEYHYRFYRVLAALLADRSEEELQRFAGLLRDEISGDTHGEVDEESWQLKQAVLRRQVGKRGDSKLFRDYARQSFIDTCTLYLHGICCDIDVETGPRQLPSRHLRKRLQLLHLMFPPPEGFVVFPEDLKK